MFLLMGAFRLDLRGQPRAVPPPPTPRSAISRADSASRRSRACRRGSRRSRARRSRPAATFSDRRLSRDAALRLSEIVRDRRDRGPAGTLGAMAARRRPCSRSTASSPSRISASCFMAGIIPGPARRDHAHDHDQDPDDSCGRAICRRGRAAGLAGRGSRLWATCGRRCCLFAFVNRRPCYGGLFTPTEAGGMGAGRRVS